MTDGFILPVQMPHAGVMCLTGRSESSFIPTVLGLQQEMLSTHPYTQIFLGKF